MKKDKIEEKFPVREGQQNNSILEDKNTSNKNKYRDVKEKDKQQKNQPEFLEQRSNKKNR